MSNWLTGKAKPRSSAPSSSTSSSTTSSSIPSSTTSTSSSIPSSTTSTLTSTDKKDPSTIENSTKKNENTIKKNKKKNSSKKEGSSSSSISELTPSSSVNGVVIPSRWSFTKVNPSGQVPAPRYGHTMVPLLSQGKLLLLGGSDQAAFSNELYEYSWETNKWALMQTNVPDDDVENPTFPRRNFHSAVVYEEAMYIFGGKSNGYWNDVWKYDVAANVWTKEAVEKGADAPAKRYGHSAVVYEDAMWVFGGYDSDSWTCNDLWKYDFRQKKWTEIKVTDGKPKPRFHHSAAVNGRSRKMYVFGGNAGKEALGDVWTFNFKKLRWRQIMALSTKEVWPSGRYGHSCVIPNSGAMYVYGGYNKQVGLTDFYSFDIVNKKWSIITVDINNGSGSSTNEKKKKGGPKADHFHSMVGSKELLMMFGGRDIQNQAVNEMWIVRPVRTRVETLGIISSLINTGKKLKSKNGALSKEELKKIMAILIDILPDEAYVLIFRYLGPVDLCQATCVCRRWSAVCEDAMLWEAQAYNYFPADQVKYKNVDSMRRDGLWKAMLKREATNKRAIREREEEEARQREEAFEKAKNPLRDWKYVRNSENARSKPMTRLSGTKKGMKLVAIGDGAVGKTCLFISYANNRFPEEYVPTVFDNYVVNLTAGEDTIELGLWDTAGPEDYDRLRPLSYANCNIFLVCFSLVNRTSFQNVATKWCPEANHFCPNVPIILVGTKLDLLEDENTLNKLKERNDLPVSMKEGMEMAKKVKAVGFIPMSSLRGVNLKLVFDEAVKAVLFGNPVTAPSNCALQ